MSGNGKDSWSHSDKAIHKWTFNRVILPMRWGKERCTETSKIKELSKDRKTSQKTNETLNIFCKRYPP